MTIISNNFEELKEISQYSTYPDNKLKDCVVNQKSELVTPLGLLIPQYDHAGVRRKHTYSVSFYPDGSIQRIALQNQTTVQTPIGKLPAELITFYNNGSIKKLFPLNGYISGYWDENDEYGLSKEFGFSFKFGSFNTRVIGISFYENGAVQSLTLWPNETLKIQTPIGEQKVRIGFSLYPDGKIKSIEPSSPIKVMTPIGLITAFDAAANGISGDKNSLNFNEDGSVKSLITSNTKITILENKNSAKSFSPYNKFDYLDNYLSFQPLKIDFDKNIIRFNSQESYKINKTQFHIGPYIKNTLSNCSDCSSCGKHCNII